MPSIRPCFHFFPNFQVHKVDGSTAVRIDAKTGLKWISQINSLSAFDACMLSRVLIHYIRFKLSKNIVVKKFTPRLVGTTQLYHWLCTIALLHRHNLHTQS